MSEIPTHLRVLSFPDLKNRKGIAWSRMHVHRMAAAGRFPKPVKLGDWTTAWLEHEIDAWIASRIADRDSAA